MSKKLLKDINQKMFMRELQQKVKTVPKEDLEQLWIEESYKVESDEYVSSNWRLICGVSLILLLLFVFSLFMGASQYPGSEYENMESIGHEFCDILDLGKLKYFDVNENDIKVTCKDGEYIFYKR